MPGSYLVDPKDHRVFQVKRQLLGGTEVRKTLDTGHHLLYADHLHYIGHHQGINKVDVGALEEGYELSLQQKHNYGFGGH